MKIHPELLATQSYVNGQWLESDKRFDVHNPATRDVVAQVADCGPDVAEQAVAAAKAALPAWRAKSANERSVLLRRWFDLIIEYQHELGVIMTLEQGKPLAEAKGEVGYGASFVEWFAEEAKRIYGDTIPAPRVVFAGHVCWCADVCADPESICASHHWFGFRSFSA